MDRNNPVTTCNTKVIPSKKPMFHRKEIEKGVGRFIKLIKKDGLTFFAIKYLLPIVLLNRVEFPRL